LLKAPPRLESRASDAPPAEAPSTVKTLVDKYTSAAKKDWCGSLGSEWVPEGAFGVNWSEACKTHDECYGTPGAKKFLCDYGLQQDIALACAAQDGGPLCYLAAGVYFDGVRTARGDEAFDRAQAAAKKEQ
jgi:hypothetical protein